MTRTSRVHRAVAAVATFCAISGGSLLLLLRLCERCASDNAYLGEVLLGLLVLVVGLAFALTWLAASRRDGLRGVAAGAIPGVGVGGVIVALGATRTLVPPALSALELALLIVGGIASVVLARTR